MQETKTRTAKFEDGDEFFSAATIFGETLYYGNIHPVLEDEIRREHAGFVRTDCVEGYVTKNGRFLTRAEAKAIADKLGIVRPGRDKTIAKELWSEYLPCWVLSHPQSGSKEYFKRAWKQ